MLFKKNIQFTRLIKVNGRAREFNFRKKQQGGSDVFDIDVSDEKGNRHYLSITQDRGQWVVTGNNVPVWLQEVYPEIISQGSPES